MNIDTYPRILIDMPRHKPMFNLEGIDGAGKSEQKVLIVHALKKMGIVAKAVSSPSRSQIGTFLRTNLYQLRAWERITLFILDMVITLHDHADYDGVLIWDRYKDSSVVSNKDMSPEESQRWIAMLPDPTRTFLLDITPETIIKKRPESLDNHSLDLPWQHLKYQRYHDLARHETNRIVVIDADRTREKITTEIIEIIVHNLTRFKFS